VRTPAVTTLKVPRVSEPRLRAMTRHRRNLRLRWLLRLLAPITALLTVALIVLGHS